MVYIRCILQSAFLIPPLPAFYSALARNDLFLECALETAAQYRDLSVEIKRLISSGVSMTMSMSGDKLCVTESW